MDSEQGIQVEGAMFSAALSLSLSLFGRLVSAHSRDEKSEIPTHETIDYRKKRGISDHDEAEAVDRRAWAASARTPHTSGQLLTTRSGSAHNLNSVNGSYHGVSWGLQGG